MAVEDAVASALLLILSATLTVLAVRAYRRYRNPSFLFLMAAFLLAFANGVVISFLVFGVLPGVALPVSFVAGVQVAILVLIYVATFARE